MEVKRLAARPGEDDGDDEAKRADSRLSQYRALSTAPEASRRRPLRRHGMNVDVLLQAMDILGAAELGAHPMPGPTSA